MFSWYDWLVNAAVAIQQQTVLYVDCNMVTVAVTAVYVVIAVAANACAWSSLMLPLYAAH
jgi:hypothetical protein